jgi:formylglycine-generating enzyme required for sulfatase activity
MYGQTAQILLSAAMVLAVAVPLGSPPAKAQNNPASETPGARFRDCPHCPEMIVVPPGQFMMGATPDHAPNAGGDGEQYVQHLVVIPKAYAVGLYDVTRSEYEVFARETGRVEMHGCNFLDGQRRWAPDMKRNWRNPGFAQSGLDPVVCVSWRDANAYVAWLNQKVRKSSPATRSTGAGPYHLPTEIEWEYAARGGADHRFPWGSEMSPDHANYGLDECEPCGVAKQGKDRWDYTSPGDAFAPNGFGIYDMAGNVWQWTTGCLGDTWTGPTNSTFTPGDCHDRILHGGSWLDIGDGGALEIIGRNPWPEDDYNYANGFRVFRSLSE